MSNDGCAVRSILVVLSILYGRDQKVRADGRKATGAAQSPVAYASRLTKSTGHPNLLPIENPK